MREINLVIKSIVVPYKPPIKVDWTYKRGKPVSDISKKTAKELGITQDAYRRMTNSKKTYKKYFKK